MLNAQHTKMPFQVEVPNVGTLNYSAASREYITHPNAIKYAKEQDGKLASLAQLGVFRAARLEGQTDTPIDRARDWHHSGTLTLFGYDSARGVMRPFEPNEEALELISQAGYKANTSRPFRELIVDLRAKTDDPLVLAIRSAWDAGAGRQDYLPA
ncbi:MAG: hypothetical protein Q8R18_01375, partial [bacterium]|nr:hypothetical protein [bacterium]